MKNTRSFFLVVLVGSLLLMAQPTWAVCSGQGTSGNDVLVCSDTSPNINGFEGSDTITILDGYVSAGFFGGSGDDYITVNTGVRVRSTIYGEDGNDIIINFGGLDTFGIDGGRGGNIIYHDGQAAFIIAGTNESGKIIIGKNATGMGGIEGDGDDRLCFLAASDQQIKDMEPNQANSITIDGQTFNYNDGFAQYGNASKPDCNPPAPQNPINVPPPFSDGRINGDELAAPVAIYCTNGGISVWNITTQSSGMPTLQVTSMQIANALEKARTSGMNISIVLNGTTGIWALSSYELQVQADEITQPGKKYNRIMPANICEQSSIDGVTNAPVNNPAVPSSGTTHTVQAGETLFRIAQRYGITVDAIARANNISNPSVIHVGQVLIIPGK